MSTPLTDTPEAGPLLGRNVVVTGGSRGLGRAMAVAMAAAGARVAVTGRDPVALHETTSLIREVGGTGSAFVLDVTDPGAADRFATEIWSAWDGIDVVVANAGINLSRPAVETTDDDFRRILETNVVGVFATCRAFGALMLARGHGKIVTVSSDVGIRGLENLVAYGASKAAVISMTKTLAWEWAPAVTVNSIAPGAFVTDMNRDVLELPDILRIVEDSIPLGRVGRVEEIGAVAVFLAGTGSDFMTGQVLSIDGGVQRS